MTSVRTEPWLPKNRAGLHVGRTRLGVEVGARAWLRVEVPVLVLAAHE